MPEKLKVLLDTSVVITALNSSTGASAAILSYSKMGRLILVTTPYIINETEEVIKRKFPKLQPLFDQLKSGGSLGVTEDPSLDNISRAAQIISDPKDAPILAAAIAQQVDYLVTLDRKDFIDDKNVAQEPRLKIVTPATLIKSLRSL